MSVIDVTKMWSKDGGKFSSEKLYNFATDITVTEGYQVLAEPGDNIGLIEQAPGIPRYGDSHSYYPDVRVRDWDISPLGPAFWLVIVNYIGEAPGTQIEIEWTDTTSTEPIDRDWDGDAIVTANGEQVDGLTVDIADQVAVVRRQFLTIDTASIRAYRRATNSDTFLGWPPGTARLVGFSAKNKFAFGLPSELWDVTARIQFREPYANTTTAEAWYKRWRHEGVYEKAADGTIQRAFDERGQETSKPVLLKTDGTREYDASAAVFIHTQVYGSLPFSGLGLV